MNIAQARRIPIETYLQRQGHNPTHKKHQGQELWYHSPIRDNDKNPSFKVNTIKNLWYDHGASRGGTIIDLVREIYACDIRDALTHLEKTKLYSPALNSPKTESPSQIFSPFGNSKGKSAILTSENFVDEKEKSAALDLAGVSTLTHPALIQYLEKRKINIDIARHLCSQIDFKRPGSAGNYFGVGFPAGDGFEVRNALFKGFVGSTKDISFLQVYKPQKLLLFEGFMDALSYLSAKKQLAPEYSMLILNSTNLWRRAIPYLQNQEYRDVELFLDNDSAAAAATAQLIETSAARNIRDMRSTYAGFDDLNAWLMENAP